MEIAHGPDSGAHRCDDDLPALQLMAARAGMSLPTAVFPAFGLWPRLGPAALAGGRCASGGGARWIP